MNIARTLKALLKATSKSNNLPHRVDMIQVAPLADDLLAITATDGKILVRHLVRGPHAVADTGLLTRDAARQGDLAAACTGTYPQADQLIEMATAENRRYKAAVQLDPKLLVRALQAMGPHKGIWLYVPRDQKHPMVLQAEESGQVIALVMPRLPENGEKQRTNPTCQQNGGHRDRHE